jgi:hypothetical protein
MRSDEGQGWIQRVFQLFQWKVYPDKLKSMKRKTTNVFGSRQDGRPSRSNKTHQPWEMLPGLVLSLEMLRSE